MSIGSSSPSSSTRTAECRIAGDLAGRNSPIVDERQGVDLRQRRINGKAEHAGHALVKAVFGRKRNLFRTDAGRGTERKASGR